MNLDQYQEMCRCCDQILKAGDRTLERVAIQFLHIVRAHPVFLQKYYYLFEKDGSPREYITNVISWAVRTTIFFAGIARMIWLGRKFRTKNLGLPTHADILIFSHLLDESQLQNEEDFYFGKLPEQLSDSGKSVVVALIRHNKFPVSISERAYQANKNTKYVIPRYLGLWDEIGILFRMMKESARLRRLFRKEKPGLLKNVLKAASADAVSEGSRTTLRAGIVCSKLVEYLQPEKVITTYEGHAWERLVYAGSQGKHCRPQKIGYVHATVFKHQHAMKRMLGEEYDPDRILVTGELSLRRLQGIEGLGDTPVSVLGSDKSSAIHSTWVKSVASTADKPTCLVIPEGIESECHKLFGFSLECAKSYPGINFIWRLHPVISFAYLERKESFYRNLPPNIILSKNDFEDDIRRSSAVLYRGSSAVFQAVIRGLIPFYYQLEGEIPIDPIYDAGEWRSIVREANELASGLEKAAGKNSEIVELSEAAMEYCQQNYSAIDATIFGDLVR